MKLIFLIIGLGFAQLYSQDIVPAQDFRNYNYSNVSHKYFKDVDNRFEPFLGNWKFIDNDNLVEITIVEKPMVKWGFYYCDELNLRVRYVHDGTEIFNTLAGDTDYLISGGVFWYANNMNRIRFLYLEPNQPRDDNYQYLKLTLHMTLNGDPELIWEQFSEANKDVSVAPQIPANMILSKVP